MLDDGNSGDDVAGVAAEDAAGVGVRGDSGVGEAVVGVRRARHTELSCGDSGSRAGDGCGRTGSAETKSGRHGS